MCYWKTLGHQRKILKILRDKWKQKHNIPKTMRCSKNASKKTANGSISLPQETRKILNKKFHFIPRESRKQRTNETPNYYKEGNMISVK